MCTIFGSIEHFVPHEVESDVQQEYPPPHDAPRSAGMEMGCWEIKWCHRDDCVGALMVSLQGHLTTYADATARLCAASLT
jgi:hypothetical protein